MYRAVQGWEFRNEERDGWEFGLFAVNDQNREKVQWEQYECMAELCIGCCGTLPTSLLLVPRHLFPQPPWEYWLLGEAKDLKVDTLFKAMPHWHSKASKDGHANSGGLLKLCCTCLAVQLLLLLGLAFFIPLQMLFPRALSSRTSAWKSCHRNLFPGDRGLWQLLTKLVPGSKL